MKQKLLIAVSILCLLPLTTAAQELRLLVEGIEKKIEANEPEWKLESKQFEENTCVAKWVYASNPKEWYLVVIRVTPSRKSAADNLAKNISAASSGPRGDKVSGIGEEAYLVKDKPGNPVSILFRQQNIFIKLLAPSEAHARRLAKFIKDSMSAKTRSSDRNSKL